MGILNIQLCICHDPVRYYGMYYGIIHNNKKLKILILILYMNDVS